MWTAGGIVVAGRGDGGAVALVAASRDRSIDGVITLDAGGSTGADLLLQQQQRVLDGLKLPAAERQARIDLQKKIQAAVISGAGWQGVPDGMRKQADTPWFKSLLTYDPAQVMPKVKQPMLIVQGDLDPQRAADRGRPPGGTGAARARRRRRSKWCTSPTPIRNSASPKVATAIAEWIKKLEI